MAIQAMDAALAWELPLPAHSRPRPSWSRGHHKRVDGVRPDPKDHLEASRNMPTPDTSMFVSIRSVPDQEGFMQFYKREIFPRLRVGRKKAA